MAQATVLARTTLVLTLAIVLDPVMTLGQAPWTLLLEAGKPSPPMSDSSDWSSGTSQTMVDLIRLCRLGPELMKVHSLPRWRYSPQASDMGSMDSCMQVSTASRLHPHRFVLLGRLAGRARADATLSGVPSSIRRRYGLDHGYELNGFSTWR